VAHVVYTSFIGAAPDATFTLARDHYVTEELLRDSGLGFTFLRDNLYSDFLPGLAGEDGVIRGPAGSGRVAAVARADVADSALAVLTAVAGTRPRAGSGSSGPSGTAATSVSGASGTAAVSGASGTAAVSGASASAASASASASGTAAVSAAGSGTAPAAAASGAAAASPHAGATYELTGPEALTLTEVADILSASWGRGPITFHDETVAEAYASRAVYEAPRWQLDAWVSTYTAIASGELARVSPDVQHLTGHPARSLHDILAP
jgi:uncharacterized protein YbjT (DUF2867 family)